MVRFAPYGFVSLAAAALMLLSTSGCSSDSESNGYEVQFSAPDSVSTTDNGTTETPTDFCYQDNQCPEDRPWCDVNLNQCVKCKTDQNCSGDLPRCHPALKECVECVMSTDCTAEEPNCLENVCSTQSCFPGKSTCISNAVHVCSDDGLNPDATVIPCGDQTCISGKCLECTPEAQECRGDSQVILCNADGTNYQVLEICAEGKTCIGAACMVCYPGGRQCQGDATYQCNNDGTAWTFVEDCTADGKTCLLGACISPCASDLKENTNAGCEFYAVDLDNAVDGDSDAQHAQFAIIVSNTSATATTKVTLTRPDGATEIADIAPSSLHKFKPASTWSLEGTELSSKSFKITADRPITVYQFNPLDNEQVFSNDASVLLPAPNLGTDYYIVSYEQMGTYFRGYFTVVAFSAEPTTVTITSSAKTLAGTGVSALSAGSPRNFTLEKGQVLNIESDQAGGDLTGTHITADQKIAVFGGHEATNMTGACCADHLEQQLTPVSAWGQKYIISKSMERWMEQDHIRIVASQDGTKVTLNPGVAIVPTLDAGEFYSFTTNTNVLVTADKPVMVAQYLASSYEILGEYAETSYCFSDGDCAPGYDCDDYFMECLGPDCSSASNCPSGHTCETYSGTGYCEPIGDPTMILAVPEEQFLDSFVFLTPDAYLQDYVNIIAPTTATYVKLDGNNISLSNFVPVGASGYGVYRTQVSDGVHTLVSDQRMGVVVYGYDNDVSYGYPGGMGLSTD